ncbi:LLM class flavin-dependent oxidoreductase [Pseudonocardia cypriaca]|uniref:Alkanesulfonate monooxygenase SsuD/methylene tetrahydromethanopterin reductase-like flavin-dependent oxidoreductase (Luciferase family) n=1 Tax=Pseudonocardia cypriaca TaxID=882449 RepID=A0A543FVM8_9PSEU|nr:LLM class flavin-dependent oxidoreductase [Pseudonocardia cypriaca]TQM37908.1 alkanesulfonate monooxygenase SsuD/methylene tetrahydromethanopterin reductase-like flavin-dependent oxidoreductase (luciferase family) [Pseudonocardia cypriaca]
MKIGMGLPAAVPGADATALGEWAATAERLGFCSLSVLDRLVYDNLDPLVALAAAAARTERVELLTTVLNVPYRQNAVVLAKQLASIDRLSGGRLTAGLALGGWPEDFRASDVSQRGLGAAMDAMVATMSEAWDGKLAGASGPMPALPPDRPGLLLGGLAPAAFTRAATVGQGWIAPSFGIQQLVDGVAAIRSAWDRVGRTGSPRVVTMRYFCIGPDADEDADHYLRHYYLDYADLVKADTPTTPEHLEAELRRLRDAGAEDVVLMPCTGDVAQVAIAADVLDRIGITADPVRTLR